jgi:hypothetical protein
VSCYACDATGWITESCTTHTFTSPGFYGTYPADTPAYVGDAVQKLGFESLREEAGVELREVVKLWKKDPEDGFEFRYATTMPVCEMDLRIDGVTSHWVFAGRGHHIHDAGGALEKVLAHDENELEKLGRSSAKWLPWFRRRAAPVLATFMESEVHQNVTEHAAAGASTDQIFEQTKRALSIEYLERVQRSLRAVSASLAAWTRIKVLLFVALLAPCAYLAARLVVLPKTLPVTPLVVIRIPVCSVAGDGYAMFALTAAVAMLGAIAARLLQMRWFSKAGGEALFRWVNAKGYLTGRWTFVVAVILGTVSTMALFDRHPAWVDREGRLYGLLKVVAPAALPAPTKASQSSKASNRNRPAAQTKAP